MQDDFASLFAFNRRGWTVVAPPWLVLRHVVNP
jgi:hypothetical protein